MPADAHVQDKGTVDGRHCWNRRTCSPTALQVYADAEETCPFYALYVGVFSKAHLKTGVLFSRKNTIFWKILAHFD